MFNKVVQVSAGEVEIEGYGTDESGSEAVFQADSGSESGYEADDEAELVILVAPAPAPVELEARQSAAMKLVLVAGVAFVGSAILALVTDAVAQGKAHEAVGLGDSPVAFGFFAGVAASAACALGAGVVKAVQCCRR